MSRVADLIDAIRSIRDQIAAHKARLESHPEASGLLAPGDRIVAALDTIEAELCIPNAEVGYDVLAGRDGGAKLASRLGWLAAGALHHEGPPTQGMREVADELARHLAEQERALDRLLAVDLAELNSQAAGLGLPFVLGKMP
jgi:hypothetical protein